MSQADSFRKLPPTTLGTIILCCGLYLIYNIVLDLDLRHVTLCPRLVLYLNEYYRIITSALFHSSLMHITINMMSTLAIATLLEHKLGSLRLLLTILWSILLTSFVYIATAVLLSSLFHKDDLMYQHAVGFSGVLFHLTVLECNVELSSSRSVLGFFHVPTYIYPVVSLFVLQLIMPNLSFMGHLAGIITGTLQVYGFLDCFAMNNSQRLEEIENWSCCRQVRHRVPTYVTVSSVTDTLITRDATALRRALSTGTHVAFSAVQRGCQAIHVTIFGRGRDANANLYLWSSTPLPTSSLLSTANVDDDYDDESWVGLPSQQQQLPIEARMV